MTPQTTEAIAAHLTTLTVDCTSAVDVSCFRVEWLLACNGFRTANLRGEAADKIAGILAKTRRALLLRDVSPARLLVQMYDESADAVLLPECLNAVCINDARDMIREAKRVARKIAIVIVPHMRECVSGGDKSTWRSEDMTANGLACKRFDESDGRSSWLVGWWVRK